MRLVLRLNGISVGRHSEALITYRNYTHGTIVIGEVNIVLGVTLLAVY